VAYLRPSADREPAYCEKHQMHFVRFQATRSNLSWGCPECVKAIREDVQRILRPPAHWLDRLKGKTS